MQAVSTGKLPLAVGLSFVPKMLAGNDRFTTVPALQTVVSLERLVPDELRPKFEHWIRTTFGSAATAVGVVPKDTDTLDAEASRSELLLAVGWFGRDPVIVAEVIKLAEKWRDLPQAVRGKVLAIAVDAKPELFDRALEEVNQETDRARRNEIYQALGSVRDPARQERALALLLDPKHDLREAIRMISAGTTDAARATAQRFFKQHHAALLGRLPREETANPLANMSKLFTVSCSATERDAIASYVTTTFGPLPGGTRVVKQNIEEMDQCIARAKILAPEVRGWLSGVRLPRPKK
jgi:hypothetical protein